MVAERPSRRRSKTVVASQVKCITEPTLMFVFMGISLCCVALARPFMFSFPAAPPYGSSVPFVASIVVLSVLV